MKKVISKYFVQYVCRKLRVDLSIKGIKIKLRKISEILAFGDTLDL